MSSTNKTKITVEALIDAPVEKVWQLWTLPEHVTKWNSASPDWHTPKAENDLRPGGKFSSRMEAKDGSMGFDFAGTYTRIIPNERIDYAFGDRVAHITFAAVPDGIDVTVSFDAEQTHSEQQQREGWQAILDNFKRYVESGNPESAT